MSFLHLIFLAISLPSANTTLGYSASCLILSSYLHLPYSITQLPLICGESIKKKKEARNGGGRQNNPNLCILFNCLTQLKSHSSFWTTAILKTLITDFFISSQRIYIDGLPKMDVYLLLYFLKSLCPSMWQSSPSNPPYHTFREHCLSKLQRKTIKADSICSPNNSCYQSQGCQANAKD